MSSVINSWEEMRECTWVFIHLSWQSRVVLHMRRVVSFFRASEQSLALVLQAYYFTHSRLVVIAALVLCRIALSQILPNTTHLYLFNKNIKKSPLCSAAYEIGVPGSMSPTSVLFIQKLIVNARSSCLISTIDVERLLDRSNVTSKSGEPAMIQKSIIRFNL